MSLASSLVSLFAAFTVDGIHPRDPALARLFGFGSATHSGVNVNADKVLALPAIYRATAILANVVMKTPFHVYRSTDSGMEPDTKHPSHHSIAVKANPDLLPPILRQWMTSQAILRGNSYAAIYRPNWPLGPVELIPLPVDSTRPVRFRNGGEVSLDAGLDGRLGYTTMIGAERRTLWAEDVIHLHGPGPNPYYGYDVVDLLAETFGGAIASAEYRNRFFGQGAAPAGFVTMEGQVDEEDEEYYLKTIRAASEGLGKAHRIQLLESGMKFQQVSIDPEKAQLIEGQQLDARFLAMAIGIKVHKIIDSANSSYNSLEQANQEHKDDDLIPWFCRWSMELSDKLLTEEQLITGSHVIGPDTESMEWVPFRERWEVMGKAVNEGLVYRDEARRKLNLPPAADDENGKRFRIPSNIVFEDEEPEAEPMPQPPAMPPDDTEDPETDEGGDDDLEEVSAAYLEKIERRLWKTAVAKARRGVKAFIHWVDHLESEPGPKTLQERIDHLYKRIRGRCDDATLQATSAAELISIIERDANHE